MIHVEEKYLLFISIAAEREIREKVRFRFFDRSCMSLSKSCIELQLSIHGTSQTNEYSNDGPHPGFCITMLCFSTYIRAGLKHVVSVPAGNGYKGNRVRIVSNLLDVGAHFLHDLLVTFLAVVWLRRVHLVDSHNELLHSESVGQEGVLTSLSILGNTCFELSHTSCHNQHSTVCLKNAVDAALVGFLSNFEILPLLDANTVM